MSSMLARNPGALRNVRLAASFTAGSDMLLKKPATFSEGRPMMQPITSPIIITPTTSISNAPALALCDMYYNNGVAADIATGNDSSRQVDFISAPSQRIAPGAWTRR
jgi:hypothetical protein